MAYLDENYQARRNTTPRIIQAGRALSRNRNAESRSNRGAPSLAQAVDRVGPHREGRPSRDGPRLTRFGFVYGASTFTPCASKSKTLPRSSYSPGTGRRQFEGQAEREGSPYVVKALRRHPDLRHYPIGGKRLAAATIERPTDPHVERRLHCHHGVRQRRHSRYLGESRVVVGAVRVLAEGDGRTSASLVDHTASGGSAALAVD